MKFLCKTKDLLQALHLVSHAISGQQALPILGNILIDVEGKRCTVSATDLELSIITSFEVDIENEGAITVPAKAILNFAQYNSEAEVLLETSEGTQLKCTSEGAKTMIAGEASSEYPTITPVKKETTFTIDAGPFIAALNMVTFASAKSSLRPVLSGVYLRTEKGNLILVATDSYRLSECRVPMNLSGTDISCIIPAKVLEELRTVLGSRRGEKKTNGEPEKEETPVRVDTIGVALSSQQIELTVGPTRLLSRLIDGKFPDYQQILPNDAKTIASIPAKELLTTVKRMHYFAKEINNNLTLSFEKKGLHIATPQTQAGKDEATLSVEFAGPPNKIALSSSYLLDFLMHTESDTVELGLTDSMHPALFHIPGDKHFLHLIMPLQLQEDAAPVEAAGRK